MRRGLVLVHRWIGIVLLIYMAMMCLTGSVLVYRPELMRYFEPQPVVVAPGPTRLSDEALLASARHAFPADVPVEVFSGRQENHAVEINLQDADGDLRGHLFDPYTGNPLQPAIPWSFWLVTKLLELHTDLLSSFEGRLVNGALALGFVFLALTGVLAWRPRKKRLAGQPGKAGGLRRLHMTVGIWSALFVLMWGVTGVHLAYPDIMNSLTDHFEPFDEMNPVERVGDQVSYWLAYLHFGRFGGRFDGCERWSTCEDLLKATWALIALAPLFLSASGLLLWWRGRRAKARVRALSRSL